MTELTFYDKQAIRAIEDMTQQGVTGVAIEITAQTKALCPVADYMGGNLKGSYQWISGDGKEGGGTTGKMLTERPKKNEAISGTPVDYGAYQEWGTRKMAAQPHIRPAIDIVVNGTSGKEAMDKAYKNTVPRELKKV